MSMLGSGLVGKGAAHHEPNAASNDEHRRGTYFPAGFQRSIKEPSPPVSNVSSCGWRPQNKTNTSKRLSIAFQGRFPQALIPEETTHTAAWFPIGL